MDRTNNLKTLYILLCDKTYYGADCEVHEYDPECFSGVFSTEDKAKAAILEEYHKHYDSLTKSNYNYCELGITSWKEEWENTDGCWINDYYIIEGNLDELWDGK